MWIFTLLLCAAAAHGLDHFPQKYVTATQQATLSCENADGEVTWTLNGEVLKDRAFGGLVRVDGPSVTVEEVDDPVLGEYACWRAGKKISSTYLLQEVEEADDLESLKCHAKSYDCVFTCIWRNSGYSVARLLLDPNCESESCPWVTSRGHSTFHFEMSHSLSPYAEEVSMQELRVEALKHFYILKTTKQFFLRDIIRPDSPRVLGHAEVGPQLRVTVAPPETWSSPQSFFSLENEIEYVLKDNGERQQTSCLLIPRKISKFRARCRDAFVPSAWSQWSQWNNVKGKKKKCQNTRCGNKKNNRSKKPL
ncbi:unnamed protein product [Knipowitschia caucasica]